MIEQISDYIDTASDTIGRLRTIDKQIYDFAAMVENTLSSRNKVIFCGNGGSAADSQHLAAELMGRFLKDRNPLPALALTVDTSALTAIGNDYGYEHVFSRQLEGIGREGDLLVGISTSGRSENIVNAIKVAQERGIKSVALTGKDSSVMSQMADHAVMAPSSETNHIQECHITIGHLVCKLVEERMFP